MPWIDGLAGVVETDFLARRDRIAALVKRASAPGVDAAELLAEAYVAACMLEGDAKARWSITEVEYAQRGQQS